MEAGMVTELALFLSFLLGVNAIAHPAGDVGHHGDRHGAVRRLAAPLPPHHRADGLTARRAGDGGRLRLILPR
ncbi:MAG: hypothetical protein V4641_18235 [Pseudomonadota bacterium]|jgi:hypothetical protein